MIKNIVFDLGNVLIKYTPDVFLKDYPDAKRELLGKEIYHSENWLKMDHGDLSEAELIDLVCSRIPESYHADAVKLIKWYELTSLVEGMEQLVLALKANGYGIYMLSNTSEAFYRFRKKIPVLKYFDGLFVSADHRLLKPDREIFRLFCKEFNLNASECVFIDDSAANVDGAKEVGFEGILFRGDASELKTELYALGIATEK